MTQVDFYYDIVSPYSYLAANRIEAIAADCGATVSWRPMLLGAVFKATENRMPAAVPAKARWMLADLQEQAAFFGLPFRFPAKEFPADTRLVQRALVSLPEAERAEASLRVYHAYWAEGQSPADPEVLRRLLGAEAVAAADTQAAKDALRELTDRAVARGAFGAPTFFVDDRMYFGHDRLPFLEQRLRALRSTSPRG
jgi:2-hydroxychromene-2-carboxylate isomerase